MPQVVAVRTERFRFWVPVIPVLLVLSPVLVVTVLVGAAACLVYGVDLVRACGTGWRVVSALPGTQVDIEQGRTAVLVSIL